SHPPSSPLFPYTTLFRSRERSNDAEPVRTASPAAVDQHDGIAAVCFNVMDDSAGRGARDVMRGRDSGGREQPVGGGAYNAHRRRSEEHTSELQSRENLVC